MENQEVLEALKDILAPKQLSYIEETVFLHTWNGKRYREMALETGYEEGYLKDIGAQLWLSLSQVLGCQITKKNLRLRLNECFGCKSLEIDCHPHPDFENSSGDLIFPGYPLPFGSPFYIKRPPIEDLVLAEIQQAGSLTRIKAPYHMGKSSLINHVLGVAEQAGMHPVLVDMQQVDTEVLRDLDRLLRWFCWIIGRELNLEPKFNQYWLEGAGSKLSCTTYVQEYFLNQIEQPIVLAIDKVHYLIEYPEVARDFFSLLRSWYEQARFRSDWQKLRLIVAHSTELEIPLHPYQSPFNVGLPLHLPELNLEQIKQLAECYQLQNVGIHDFSTLQPLLHLLGGHPYLLQLAFYWLQSRYLSLTQLLKEAPTDQGIYSEFLRRYWLGLQWNDSLRTAFYKVLSSSTPISLDTAIAYQLAGMGLIKLDGAKASPQCELYRQYFCMQLT